MDKIPQRSNLAKPYRAVLNRFEGSLFFPFKNPSCYQVIAILLSVGFLFLTSRFLKILTVTVVLFLDWLDGAAARKYGQISRKGWMIDVAVDRITEGLIFISEIGSPLGKILFALYILNIFLSFYSVKTGKHYIIALRFFYLVLLIFKFM